VNWCVIEFVVQDCSSPIFDSIFDSGNDNNDNQRRSRKTWVRCAENREDLRVVWSAIMYMRRRKSRAYRKDNDKQEVHVCDIVELQPQVLGHKTDGRVLRRPDLVTLIMLQRVSLFILGFGW